MTNINKNSALETLQELVQSNLSKRLEYMPDSFNKQQQLAVELFQKRIFLEKIIEETVAFNRNLNFEKLNKNLNLATSAEELVEVFKLRSEVYTGINYQDEFPDTIEGLNFDKYDTSSAIIYYEKDDKKITGTTRLIFDSQNKLPSEQKFSFDPFRPHHKRIGEISRLIITQESKGLNLEFKYLMAGLHNVFNNNDIGITLSGIKQEHYKLYSKFGGIDIVKEMDSYGKLDTPFLIISWDPSQASKFFQRTFLKQ